MRKMQGKFLRVPTGTGRDGMAMEKKHSAGPMFPSEVEEPGEELGPEMGYTEFKEPQPAAAKKLNRHVVIALNHMRQRQADLIKKRDAIQREIEEIGAAMVALDPARSVEQP